MTSSYTRQHRGRVATRETPRGRATTARSRAQISRKRGSPARHDSSAPHAGQPPGAVGPHAPGSSSLHRPSVAPVQAGHSPPATACRPPGPAVCTVSCQSWRTTEGRAVGWALAPAWRWHTGMERPRGTWQAEAGFIPRGFSNFAFLFPVPYSP